MIRTLLLCLSLLCAAAMSAQPRLQFHTESIDALLVWFDEDCPQEAIPVLTKLPAHRFMEQILHSNEPDTPPFAEALAVWREHRQQPGYLLPEAREHRQQIAALARALSDPAFSQSIWEDVAGYFPANCDTVWRPTYEVYFTATGWQWGDANAFCYSPDNYSITEKGTPAILFNLTLVATTYGKDLPQQSSGFRRVLAHELFHSLISDYRAARQLSPPRTLKEQTLFALYNEGLAHYIADGEYLRTPGDEALRERERQAFDAFTDACTLIFDEDAPPEVRRETLAKGLYGSYWDKYICMTGLMMARHIERLEGRGALRECVAAGPEYFVARYDELCRRDTTLPRLPVIRLPR